MSAAKHTPGPWVFVSQADWPHTQIVHVTAQNWGVVANLRIDPAMPHLADRQRANLRLIAAAPELLEALQSARAVIQADRDSLAGCHTNPHTKQLDAAGAAGCDEYDVVLAQIDAAIAKATGEQA